MWGQVVRVCLSSIQTGNTQTIWFPPSPTQRQTHTNVKVMSTLALQKINCLIGRKWLQLPLVAMELLMIDVINKAGALYFWIQAKRHIRRGGRDRYIWREGDSKWAHVSNHCDLLFCSFGINYTYHMLLLHTALPSHSTRRYSFFNWNTSLVSTSWLRTQGSYDNLVSILNKVPLWALLMSVCMQVTRKWVSSGFLQTADQLWDLFFYILPCLVTKFSL